MSQAHTPPPRHGFRFTTLALAISPLLPIVATQTSEGTWELLSFGQALLLHLRTAPLAHLGGALLILPALSALLSLAIPTTSANLRLGLSVFALIVAALGPLLLHLAPPALAAWFALDAMIPAERFVRFVWMTPLIAGLWVFMEARPLMEPR